MKKYKRIILICAAILSAAVMSGCREGSADWDDTLPSVATEPSYPTVSYKTEEITTTTPVTIITTEKTKRTAASSTTPELATTTATTTEAPTQTTVPTDIPKVPISEFTSTTAVDPLTETAATAETTVNSSPEASGSGSAESESGTSASGTELDNVHTVYSADEIERPYSYNQLNEKQMYIYDAVVSAAERLQTDVNFSSVMEITSDDYCEVYQQIYNDEHALFYIDTKMQYAVNANSKKIASSILFYKYSTERIKEMQSEIEAEANKVLAGVTADMSEYDKVKYFYDYLASNVVYDESEENCRDIYGVFVKKKAICGGYSKAFSYLCDKVGIETATVTGDADGEPHMWNKVKIDGKWYNIDVTYAVTDSSVGSYVRYDYFCVTDEMLENSRTVYEQIYTYPEAVSDECDYYVKNGLVADSWDDVRAMLINQIGEQSKNKEMVIQVKCSSKELYDDASYKLFDSSQKQAIKIFEEALSSAANKYDCTAVNYSQDATSLVIKLFLKYTD